LDVLGHVDEDGRFSWYFLRRFQRSRCEQLMKVALAVYDCFGAFTMKMFINTRPALYIYTYINVLGSSSKSGEIGLTRILGRNTKTRRLR